MAITVEVKPDLSRFRKATLDEITSVLCDLPLDREIPVISEASARKAAKALLRRFVILPR